MVEFVSIAIALLGIGVILFLFREKFQLLVQQKVVSVPVEFPSLWRKLLMEKVPYYNTLSPDDKRKFEQRVLRFLQKHRITGVDVELEVLDKLLIASSGVMLLFRFDDWEYTNIDEILVYPNAFNQHFETSGKDRSYLGMVGGGVMNGKMVLSRAALRHGFSNTTDKHNTAIHEFAHLIDMQDGVADGVPAMLMERSELVPWMKLVHQEITEIQQHHSDIDPYASMSEVEFFAVVVEYFFERPQLMKKKHPELYQYMERSFGQHLAESSGSMKSLQIGRKDNCPCGSGKKFKHCCGNH